MKILFILAVLFAISSCQVYPMNIGNECSAVKCATSYWYYNNTSYNYTCPSSGKSMAQFRNVQGNYVLDFVGFNYQAKNYQVTVPLIFNQNATVNGLQYYSNLQYGQSFVILNCTLPAARKYTNLCSKHALVGGKIYDNTFQNACAFGMDAPRFAFLSQEKPFEFESSI
ncbi:hypothetical protein ABPG74_016251 [Tetrahymena malaccensis]